MPFLELERFAAEGGGKGKKKKKALWHLLIKLFRNIFSRVMSHFTAKRSLVKPPGGGRGLGERRRRCSRWDVLGLGAAHADLAGQPASPPLGRRA